MVLSFDDLAAHFDEQRGLPAAALREWTGAVNMFAAGRTLSIIEPGIGTGRITLPLAVAGHNVTGIDISRPMLEACARKAETLHVAERVTLIHVDATSLPVDDDAFDVGVMASLLYLMPEWESLLDELARVVQPGGAIVHLIERTESGNDLLMAEADRGDWLRSPGAAAIGGRSPDGVQPALAGHANRVARLMDVRPVRR
jgi:ubiquinone/menaquinone biosynthesis C-methylase UbiE